MASSQLKPSPNRRLIAEVARGNELGKPNTTDCAVKCPRFHSVKRLDDEDPQRSAVQKLHVPQYPDMSNFKHQPS